MDDIAGPLRVMTWNIRVGIEAVGGLRALGGAIRDVAPDVVALQEVGRAWVMGPPGDQASVLAAESGLAHHHFFPALTTDPGIALRDLPRALRSAVGAPAGAPCYGIALLAAHPLVRPWSMPLTRDADEPRIVAGATLLSPGGPVSVVLTHLSVRAPERAVQAREVVVAVESLPKPIVFLGDINDDPASITHELFVNVLDDVAADAGPTFPARVPRHRYDVVLTAGLRVSGTAQVPDVTLSDHRPVWCDLI